ncbi:MAG: radical SAM protein [Thermoguttaceae bacterium]|nr:radical SAM protein [Thermoguttaceae bacterium]
MNNNDVQYNRPAFYFQWHFLEACNLRCRHCYQNGYIPQIIDRSLINMTMTQISNALKSWEMDGRLSLTGGEPLIDTTTLYYILDNASLIENLIHIGLLTNGTLLTDRVVDSLSRYSKLREVQVSLDGVMAKTHDYLRGNGSFDRTIAGVKKLIAVGIPVTIMFTASKLNMKEAPAVVDLAADLQVTAVTVERYTPFHFSDDPLALTPNDTKWIFEQVLLKKIKYRQEDPPIKIRTSRPLWNILSENSGGACPVGFSCLTIMHDGKVYPCRRLPIELGTIQKDGLFKIWYTSPVLWRLRDRSQVSKCNKCPKSSLCGGCRAAAFVHTGDMMGIDPLCWKEN